MTVLDYLRVKKDEEEWESLPDSLILGWFDLPDNPRNRNRIKEKARAVMGAQPASGPYPVVVYAASFLASSTENFALCEFLASHGYIVLAIPGRGANDRPMRGSAALNAEAQARDLEFVMARVQNLANADPDRIALMDYSFGGLATTMVALRNERVKALVSLDGRSRYDYENIYASPTVQGRNLDVPFFHAAQKIIPDEVLIADGIDPTLNTEFRLFDSLRASPAYALRFHDLSHRHFSSYGLLLKDGDARQDRSDERTTTSHRLLNRYVLSFLERHLRNEEASGQLLDTASADGGMTGELVTVETKNLETIPQLPSFGAFHDAVRKVGYDGLAETYAEFRQRQPNFTIAEWKLNTLGLQLGFAAATYADGVAIYEFALSLYPDSANLWDSLGLVHQVNGDFAAARASYRKSLALNPGNGHARMRLGQLGE